MYEPEAETFGARPTALPGMKRFEQTWNQIARDVSSVVNGEDDFVRVAAKVEHDGLVGGAVTNRISHQVGEHLRQASLVPISVKVSVLAQDIALPGCAASLSPTISPPRPRD